MNTSFKTIEDMTGKFLSLKGNTTLKFKRTSIEYYDSRECFRQSGSFHFQEDVFSENAQNIAISMHDAFRTMKVFPTAMYCKPENVIYIDF